MVLNWSCFCFNFDLQDFYLRKLPQKLRIQGTNDFIEKHFATGMQLILKFAKILGFPTYLYIFIPVFP